MLALVGGLLFLVAASLHYLLMAFEDMQTAERQAIELQLLARDAELKALRTQIDPHFLFNSLHSISALTSNSLYASITFMRGAARGTNSAWTATFSPCGDDNVPVWRVQQVRPLGS